MKNELLSLLPEYVPLGVIIYANNGLLKYANNFALNMFATTIEEVYDIVNLFDDPNIGDEDKEMLRKGFDVSFETDYDFNLCEEFYDSSIKQGRKYFVTKVAIMRDAAGVQKGYILTCEDVTEKKAQEQKIIESHQKITLTQKELWLALNAGKQVSWNYVVEECMFYKFDVLVENIEKRSLQYVRDNIHSDDKEKFETILEAIITKQKLSVNSVVLRVWKDEYNDYRYCSFMFSAREDGLGYITDITFIQRDITEEMIYQQNLIEAKNKAEEADKLKSAFLANMSHEIRTPLNAIVGFSALLSETEEQEEKTEYKQLIETNSDILLKLIGDILDLSKIEVGSIDISRQELDLAQLCDELFRSFQQRVKDPKVTVKLINPYTKCLAQFDKHRFIQIFTNFVTNAIKYTPEGEIIMGYECFPGKVRLFVRDTGIGIPDEKKSRIFSRFEKLDTFAQGTGLGLSICKAIAEATGGEIGFESKENEGSEFWYIGNTNVEFEKDKQASDESVGIENADHVLSDSLAKIKDLSILVAEDNDSNYLLIKTLLKDNYLTRALTGVEAVEKVMDQVFDVIFMDMRMPVMGGLEATALIREFNKEIPIIALTANAFNSDREAALAAGCNFFMTKPLKMKELSTLLAPYSRIV